jgi:hypothetical protein
MLQISRFGSFQQGTVFICCCMQRRNHWRRTVLNPTRAGLGRHFNYLSRSSIGLIDEQKVDIHPYG